MDNYKTRLDYVNNKLALFKKAEEQRIKLLDAREIHMTPSLADSASAPSPGSLTMLAPMA